MSKVDYITIKGFKSIASIEKLELKPINVLIGANGAGKSNFIEVFSLLREVRLGRLQHYVRRAGGASKLLHFGSKTTSEIIIEISFDRGKWIYRLPLEPTDNDALEPGVEITFSTGWPKGEFGEFRDAIPIGRGEAGISDPSISRIFGFENHSLDSFRVYHFEDTGFLSPMKLTSDINDNRFLQSDAANLASFLYFLREKHLGAYRMIVQTIRQVAPFFKEFVLEPLNLNPNTIRLQWGNANAEDIFDVSSLSDGTLRFIALATLFLQPEELRPPVIIVDEPEIGLHPVAIDILGALIRQASDSSQVIVSTQSSRLVDTFEPDNILVADCIGGNTDITRLPHESLDAWLEDFSLGELWEKNEFGGVPAYK